MTAPVELVRELLSYRDMRFNNHRDWGMLTAFLAGSSLALPILAPFAIGSMIALGVHTLRGARRARTIVGVTLPSVAPPPAATTVYGVARKFRGTVTSLVDDAQVLVEHAQIKDRKGSVLLRRSDATPFLLDRGGTNGEGPVLVTGVARIATPNMLAHKSRIKRGDPRLVRMGVPLELGVSGDLEVATVGLEGAELAVTGVLEEEAIVELAFHRDTGRIPVIRGRIGAPVVISDRRLIGAGLG